MEHGFKLTIAFYKMSENTNEKMSLQVYIDPMLKTNGKVMTVGKIRLCIGEK